MALNVIKMIFYFEWEEAGNSLYKTVAVKKTLVVRNEFIAIITF